MFIHSFLCHQQQLFLKLLACFSINHFSTVMRLRDSMVCDIWWTIVLENTAEVAEGMYFHRLIFLLVTL